MWALDVTVGFHRPLISGRGRWCEGYVIDGRAVRSLPFDRDVTLEHMERLGASLCSATPVETPSPADVNEWVDDLEGRTGVRVSHTSAGPTHAGKAERV